LGTNFVYRLMFLLLCLPQLLDWQVRPGDGQKSAGLAELALLILLLGVLWSNGNANGHSIFLVLPQIARLDSLSMSGRRADAQPLKTGFGLSFVDRFSVQADEFDSKSQGRVS
jgi:hypothetical protein